MFAASLAAARSYVTLRIDCQVKSCVTPYFQIDPMVNPKSPAKYHGHPPAIAESGKWLYDFRAEKGELSINGREMAGNLPPPAFGAKIMPARIALRVGLLRAGVKLKA